MPNVKILFFSADPLSTQGHAQRLLLDVDMREIRQKVRMARHGDALEFDFWPATRTDDLLQALNEGLPQVVHFSGHGNREGLVLVSADGRGPHVVQAEGLKQLFEAFQADIRVVVLSACYSAPQAQAIAEVVGCAIGTHGAISDQAAITFAASFYRAIAFGRSVKKAFDQARAAVALEHFDERDCPALVVRPDIDPARLVLVPSRKSVPRTQKRFSSAKRRSSVIPRRARTSAAIEAFKTATAERLRGALQQKVPRADAASLRAPIQDVFWLPSVFRKPDVGWSRRPVSTGGAGASVLAPPVHHGAPETPGSAELDGFGSPRATERVTVIVGEGGAGKSVLTRLLALGLVEGTCLLSGLPALLSGRDLPVLIDLRQVSADLLAGPESPAAAARRCIQSALGTGVLLESVAFANRGTILLDEVEALPWDNEALAHRCSHLLTHLLNAFPGIPRIVAVRPFGEKRVAEALRGTSDHEPESYAGFMIAPVTQGDLRQIAAVHLYDGRDAAASSLDDPRVRSLLHNRDIRRFAVSPLFVKIALDTITETASAGTPRTDQIIGRYYDQMIDRGRIGRDDTLPVSARSLRRLLHEMAVRLVASEESALFDEDLLECARALDLSAGEVRSAAGWLRDRTDLVAADPNGGLSFTQNWYRETLAAEELAEHRSADAILELARAARWYEPVKYCLSMVRPQVARDIILRLVDAGLEELALDGCVQAAGRLPPEAGDELLGRLFRISLGGLSKRLSLITAVSELETPLARTLLVNAALPVCMLSAQDAFDTLVEHGWAPPLPPDETVRIQKLRISSNDHLRITESYRDDGRLIIGYVDAEGEFGGSWATASICADVDREKLPDRSRSPVEVLEALLTRTHEDVATALTEAALARHDAADQLRLVAMALVAERVFAEAARGFAPLRSQVQLLLRGLQGVAPSESPAFTIGLVNALLARAPLAGESEIVAGLMAVRRAAILEYAKHLGKFYRRTSPDGRWTAPTSETPTPPRLADVLPHVQAELRGVALEPPVPSVPAAWKRRSLFDSYVASAGRRIHKLKAKDTSGRWAYYFVMVAKELDDAFIESLEGKGTIDLEEYGQVVASNFGEQPTEEIREFLFEKYGFSRESTGGRSN